jgi:hypothetical protein
MNFVKLVKKILEDTTTASVGMTSGGAVFSGKSVYGDPEEKRIPSLIGGGKIIRRSKPELITTPLFKGIKKVTSKKRKKRK